MLHRTEKPLELFPAGHHPFALHKIIGCIPGHMQRGGSPSAYDRVLATQFGSYAAQLVEVERYGVTVAMVNRRVTENRLADIAGKTRNVPENCELLSVARRMGVCLG